MVEEEEAKLYCALFHDPHDVRVADRSPWRACAVPHTARSPQGWEFGRLVARSILTAFFTAHASELGRLSHSLRDMTEFTGQIADAVRRSIHPVLYKRACAGARCPPGDADGARHGA